MPAHDILKGAPLFIQRRYNSIRAHVRSVLETEYPKVNLRRIPSEDLEFIQLIAFVFILRSFFSDGHKAAERAVKIFNDLGVQQFSIGRATFAPNSEAVLMGKKLADDLLMRIDDEALKKMIIEAKSLGELARELFEGLGHG